MSRLFTSKTNSTAATEAAAAAASAAKSAEAEQIQPDNTGIGQQHKQDGHHEAPTGRIGAITTSLDAIQHSMFHTMKHHRLVQIQFFLGILVCVITTTYVLSDKVIQFFSESTEDVMTKTMQANTFQHEADVFVKRLLNNPQTQNKVVEVLVLALNSKPVKDTALNLVYTVLDDPTIQRKVTELVLRVVAIPEVEQKLGVVVQQASVDALQSEELMGQTKEFVKQLLDDDEIRAHSATHVKEAARRIFKFGRK
jgi:hypothetical protein